ncbi:ergothioneine biosynthesis protein EgtB, partial [Alphaproteobacteria bacterium]|nr:ergothioneine biosynthesis protein EgtB [Alphaproteobacteria bacterium]
MNKLSKIKFNVIDYENLESLQNKFISTRNHTELLASKVRPEDQTPQSMEDCSPLKWHRAHTTWFYEEVILKKYDVNYTLFDESFSFLFNSYYESLGKRYPRKDRGLIIRPTVEEVTRYRKYVDELIVRLFQNIPKKHLESFVKLIKLGIAHEEQHIELLQSDILNLYSKNKIVPIFFKNNKIKDIDKNQKWIHQKGGIFRIGLNSKNFSFDCEGPQHEVLIKPFQISSTLVTNKDWKDFIKCDGYNNPEMWLSDGWSFIRENNINSPLYWINENEKWVNITLSGKKEINDNHPVSHISFYEADAFARWSKKRLPTEFEWEFSAKNLSQKNNFKLYNFFGTLWQWTSSYFTPYPNYEPYSGSIGEYNGK